MPPLEIASQLTDGDASIMKKETIPAYNKFRLDGVTTNISFSDAARL